MAAGGACGILAPATVPVLDALVAPSLVVLLFATFLAVPFGAIARAVRDGRFLAAVLVLNFVLIPVFVFAMSRFIAHDQVLLAGVLLVLLTPCIDYVIVFTRIAGGDAPRLLAVSPLLMLGQLALLPVYLRFMAGPEVLAAIDVGPFAVAFLVFIVLPLTLAALTQRAAVRLKAARAVERTMDAAMVPLLAFTLAVIIGAQIESVRMNVIAVLTVVPVFVAFLVGAPLLGILVARIFGQDTRAARAVVFSGTTRNSLVVLPLALTLPDSFALAPVVVVTQTLIELVGMTALLRIVPRLLPGPAAARL
ncbi:arsenic resistance protein [Microbacterium enclense]|uniref:Arsenic resistance protein n=2 Tax=Microbacterium enclense TaxID=993073 RepID=A0A3S3MC88_9MICO|nr:arsenic resistance protein [Microbacterium enclense]